MQIRRSARIIVGLGGVLLVWYALLTGVLDPSRRKKAEPEDPGPLLSGQVTFDGEPVTALVEIREAPGGDEFDLMLPFGKDPVSASVETSAEGEFEFSGVPVGRYEVRALGPEGTVARKWVEFDPDRPNPPIRLGLETGSHVLVGRAGWHLRGPFTGFVLAYTRGDTRDPAGTWTAAVRPDEAGRFEIAGFRERDVCLAFLVPGEARSEHLGVTIPDSADGPGPVEFVVDKPNILLAGTVVDEAGNPIEGAVVTIRSRSEDSSVRATTRSTTGKDGRFYTWAHSDDMRWTVAAEGRATKAGAGFAWPDAPIVLPASR